MRDTATERRAAPAGLLALLLALGGAAGGCTVALPGTGEESGGSSPSPSRSAADETCAEVRAGIDAYNAGDFQETVRRFSAALPTAEQHAEEDDSRRAALLLEAVRWYAELPPADYPEAARSSRQFQRYKAVTLAQCVVGAPDDGGPDDEPRDGASSGGAEV